MATAQNRFPSSEEAAALTNFVTVVDFQVLTCSRCCAVYSRLVCELVAAHDWPVPVYRCRLLVRLCGTCPVGGFRLGQGP